jgi:type VI secretion system secreted protein Hcp
MPHVDYFLMVDGVDGEASDSKHKNEIEVMSFSWGATNSGTMAFGGGGGAGKVQFQDVSFSVKTNKSSPKLFLACASGEHIKKAVLTVRKAGKDQQEFYKFTLSDLLITSYQSGGSGGSDIVPTDSFSLNFSKVEFEYKSQKADGTLDAAVKAGWDLKQNKKV